MKIKSVLVRKGGYALLTAILAVNLFAVLALKARSMWETEIKRDLEEELIFRARQYVMGIDLYMKKNPNQFPQNLDELAEKKFVRKRFKDPMSLEGKWNLVMEGGSDNRDKKTLLIVPEDMAKDYISRARIVGVCSTSCEEGFLIYRKKKKYCEWAIYLGEDDTKDMPELQFIGQPGMESSSTGDDEDDDVELEDEAEEEPEERDGF